MKRRERRPRIRKRAVLAAYLVLLAASHAVRASRPEPAPPPGLSLQRVEGWPQPARGPVTIAYREWRTDYSDNLSIDNENRTGNDPGISR